MNAVDTSVVVRCPTRDDPHQSPRAQALIADGPVLVPVTVVLETEWVLRRSYRFRATDFKTALRSFLALPAVSVTERDAVVAALDLCDAVMDFADALHLMHSQDCETFVTFARALAEDAAAAGARGVREP